jgi:ATP-binding cassette, subfamily B, bacterial
VTPRLIDCAWPTDAAGAALEVLAAKAGLTTPRSAARSMPGAAPSREDEIQGIEEQAAALGVEAVPVQGQLENLTGLVRRSAPVLLRLTDEGGTVVGWLAILRGGRHSVTLLTPGHKRRRLRVSTVAAALGARAEAVAGAEVEDLLDEAGVAGRQRWRVRRSLAVERLRGARVARGWLFRLPSSASFSAQLRREGVFADLARFVATYTVSYGLLLMSWWTLGKGALEGRLDGGWLAAWALLLLTLLPARYVSTWSRVLLGVRFGALLKRRLLQGALRLDSDEMRREGAGRFLSRVIESEEVEAKALTGGFLAVVAVIELVLSLGVLGLGAAGGVHVVVALLWALLVAGLAWRFLADRRTWTAERLDMTHILIERMVGHSTRLVQEARGSWHEEEDRDLERYQRASRRYDRSKTLLLGIGSRGWVLVGLAALAPAFVTGEASRVALAVGLGGVITAYRGFGKMAEGFSHLTGAVVAWEQAGDLFRAGARLLRRPSPGLHLRVAAPAREGSVLEAHDLHYRHRGRAEEVLAGISLTVRRGERLLLEGPSGGGKSTLTAVLAGLRPPGSGLLLLGGLDPATLGESGWRQRVVAVPQFHENHVVTESLAFNLLMGRGWPPAPDDLEDAEEVCRELGLGGLLERMPSGLQQLVGETGWQLSHGERSRVYLARALLQRGEVVILDESFAALDPSTLGQVLDCTLRRAQTLLVVAHR